MGWLENDGAGLGLLQSPSKSVRGLAGSIRRLHIESPEGVSVRCGKSAGQRRDLRSCRAPEIAPARLAQSRETAAQPRQSTAFRKGLVKSN